MRALRKIPFVIALLIILVVVLVEREAVPATAVASRLPAFVTGDRTTTLDRAIDVFSPAQRAELDRLRSEKADEIAGLPTELSGFGVSTLQFVDGYLLFTIALMALGLLIPEYIQAKIQGILTLIFAIIVIIFGIIQFVLVLVKLITMVALLLSFPFGTLAYLIIYGSFPRTAASAVLSLLFLLKILFVIVLIIAHQKFIENKGLVIFVLVSFLGNLIVALLYGIVPGILVSITDAIAALILIIIGIILAIVLIIGAIGSIILALKPI